MKNSRRNIQRNWKEINKDESLFFWRRNPEERVISDLKIVNFFFFYFSLLLFTFSYFSISTCPYFSLFRA